MSLSFWCKVYHALVLLCCKFERDRWSQRGASQQKLLEASGRVGAILTTEASRGCPQCMWRHCSVRILHAPITKWFISRSFTSVSPGHIKAISWLLMTWFLASPYIYIYIYIFLRTMWWVKAIIIKPTTTIQWRRMLMNIHESKWYKFNVHSSVYSLPQSSYEKDIIKSLHHWSF